MTIIHKIQLNSSKDVEKKMSVKNTWALWWSFMKKIDYYIMLMLVIEVGQLPWLREWVPNHLSNSGTHEDEHFDLIVQTTK